jgi:hypothetical protein
MGDEAARFAALLRPKSLRRNRFCQSNGGNTRSMGEDFGFLENDSKKLLFFNKMVGRVATELGT